MHEKIEVRIQNTNEKLYVSLGATLSEVLSVVYPAHEAELYLAAYVNNKIKELDYPVYSSKSIRFISAESTEGRRVYVRSLIYLLQKAARDILGDQSQIRVMHPAARGYYFNISGQQPSEQLVSQLCQRMRQLVDADIAIVRKKVELDQAKELFLSQGLDDKISLMETRPQSWVSVYNLAGLYGYFYGALVQSTGKLQAFDIKLFGNGFVLLLPSKEDKSVVDCFNSTEKLFNVFRRNQEWIDILGIPTIGALNARIMSGGGSELIKIGEALQEKNFADLADAVYAAHLEQGIRIVMVAGPSSSGKTTFAKRLSIQLSVLGLKPLRISLDDYFVERQQTPVDQNGNFDFECLEAIDIEMFNRDLQALLLGEQISLPRFDFIDGHKRDSGNKIRLDSKSILIIEGIHGLNPSLTPHIGRDQQFKIYASALTALSIDNTSIIHTTDNRLLRRIVRDHNFRGRSAEHTLRSWPSVRQGEDLHIFPYQENADAMFNTALLFEFSILKKYAEPLLWSVPANTEHYAEAVRLNRFLGYFTPLDDSELPPTSILREFLGNSGFEY